MNVTTLLVVVVVETGPFLSSLHTISMTCKSVSRLCVSSLWSALMEPINILKRTSLSAPSERYYECPMTVILASVATYIFTYCLTT